MLTIKYRVSCILIISTTKIWILKKAVQSLSPQPVSHSFILIVKMNHSHSAKNFNDTGLLTVDLTYPQKLTQITFDEKLHMLFSRFN